MSRVRRLNEPVPAEVVLSDGWPVVVSWRRPGPGRRARARQRIEDVLDVWHVDDGWWTDQPLQRIYYECQLVSGIRVVVTWDQQRKAWYVHR